MISRKHIVFLPFLSGLLLAGAWPERGFPLLLLIAFVPLLIMENMKRNDPGITRISIYWMVFPAFLIWNTLTIWWIYNSTFFGAAVAVLLNTFMQSLMFWLFHFTRKNRMRGNHGYIALIFFWIAFEYIHHEWDLNFPWLTLGNGFAAWPRWIQWYEYTGTFGGSLWILIVNILLFKVYENLTSGKTGKNIWASLPVPLLVIILPVAASFIMYYNYEEKPVPLNVVAVQPNIDPYEEQYELPATEVIDGASALAAKKTNESTDFILFPESMIQPNFHTGERFWENTIDNHYTIDQFRQGLLARFPNSRIIAGYSSSRDYRPGDFIPSTAREYRDGSGYYDNLNAAYYIELNGRVQASHKSKLTPGVELMPFPWLLAPLGDIAIDLGGTVGQLGMDAERTPFTVNDSLKVAPIICYESVYGEFVAGFIKNGANAIFIITNDGWWGNTAGHRQHMLFSVIRAIETRRSVARSANTGISCFVNQRGDITQRTAYWVPDVIASTINANDKITFYVKHGDYIARGSALGAVLLLLISLVFHFKPEIEKRRM